MENHEGNAEQTSQVEGAVAEKSPASGSNSQTQNNTPGGANAGANESSFGKDFHKNPEVQSFLERQTKRQEREWNQRLQDMQKTYDQKFADLQQSFQKPGQSISEQDASQLRQLAKLIQSDPEAAKILGLDSIKTLQDELQNMRSSSSQSLVEREAESVVGEYAKKYGYEPKQLERELWEFIRDDDYWGSQDFSKGIFTKAARDFFSDKAQELADRAANMKLVTENTNKNKAGTQKPLGNSGNQEKQPPRSMREAILQSMDGMKKEGVTFAG